VSHPVRIDGSADLVLQVFERKFRELLLKRLMAMGQQPSSSFENNIRLLANQEPPVVLRLFSRAINHVIYARAVGRRELDAMVDVSRFVSSHSRWPSQRMLFNDVLFRMKRSGELAKPLRVRVTDKELAKRYIGEIVGEEYNVPTLAVLRSDQEIDAHSFPFQCVIKSTHACKEVIIRRGGEPIDRDEIKRWLRTNYYDVSREENYRPLVPKIIVEPIVFDGRPHLEYKAFCWNGKPRLYFCQSGSGDSRRRIFYDEDWNELSFSLGVPKPDISPPVPARAQDMTALAARLSAAFNFIRVDFYASERGLYVGELTSCHASASQQFIPQSAEIEASRLLFGDPAIRNKNS
jgi:hypothetical protein